jgi:acetyl esterase/lipase
MKVIASTFLLVGLSLTLHAQTPAEASSPAKKPEKQAETGVDKERPVPAGVTSETNRKLKRLMALFPEADENKDGILTMEEALAARSEIAGALGNAGGKMLKPDHENVAYGPHERNVLDLWIAESDKPTPLLLFIHGGGFKGGDKEMIRRSAPLIQSVLDHGVSVAAINYRLTEKGKNPYPIPMHDGARALQFLRHHAEKYNLDKSRVASTGGSAGGCMTLWLGLHDDLADPDNEDPVLRESTRLTAMLPVGAQSCLHLPTLLKWFDVESLQEHGGARPLFGIPAGGDIEMTPELDALTRDASPITHLSKDDPPAYMVYGPNKPVSETSPPNLWVHHPIMGLKLKEAMDELGLECHVDFGKGAENKDHEKMVEFVLKHLGVSKASG